MPDLHALCCGRLAFDRSVFFPDAAPGTTTNVPVPGWLISSMVPPMRSTSFLTMASPRPVPRALVVT